MSLIYCIALDEDQLWIRHIHWRTIEKVLRNNPESLPAIIKGANDSVKIDAGILIVDNKRSIILSSQSAIPNPNQSVFQWVDLDLNI